MTNPNTIETVIAKQDIMDCLLRICRGSDRLDREMVLSGFHQDALDVHCSIWGKRIPPNESKEYKGDIEEHADWMFGLHANGKTMTQHRLSNVSSDVDGDVAHVESFVLHTSCNPDSTISIASARYVDRFEKRNGEWKIALRYAFPEWAAESGVKVFTLADMNFPFILGKPSRDRTDPSYLRPLPDPGPND